MSTITNYRLIELIKSFVCISTILKIESYVLLDVRSFTSILRCILIILTYIDAVKELSGGNSTLTEEAKRELTQRMERFLPGAGLTFLIAQSADPVAAELAAVATVATAKQ